MAKSPGTADEGNLANMALPVIAAAFLVKFDDRKGYTLAWQETIDGLDLEGAVEFRSMPSGLHNVKEDLVYFVYEEYAGVSAVLNVEDQGAARNARVIAVGVLVPLEHGRMGKSWLHAEGLKDLAAKQIEKGDDYTLLEEFWNEHGLSVSPEPVESDTGPMHGQLAVDTNLGSKPLGYQMNRSMSLSIVPGASSYVLPDHHPALALPEFLRLFGPLIFPLARAALLRKRILFLGETPVERTCDYVYNLSVLSALPKPITTIIPSLDPAYIRLKPLFNVGVADISFLESESKSPDGWIACTTDDVICTKPELFDVLVILPSAMSENSKVRPYPKMFLSSSELSRARPKYGLRASQRDAKRFTNISKGLQSIPRAHKHQPNAVESSAVESSSETSPEAASRGDSVETASIRSTASSTISLKSVVEPQSWSRIAYTSLVWWASAGDTRSGLTELEENENEQDVALLTGQNLEGDEDGPDDEVKTREVTCVQYFHRWTNLMFTAVSDAIRRHDGYEPRYQDNHEQESVSNTHQGEDGDEENRALLPDQPKDVKQDEDDRIEITQEDMQNMGLDVWSQSDREFVEELIKFWWQRKADVQSGRIECCGVRIL